MSYCAINNANCQLVVFWKAFITKIIKEYHDLYLKRNPLILICVL